MYIEASSPRKPKDDALLMSETFERTTGTGKCLRFWYYMYGTGMGTLNVYLYPVRIKVYVGELLYNIRDV